MSNVQVIINQLMTNNFSKQNLEQYLESPYVLIKVNAIIAVLRNKIADKSVIHMLNHISQNIQNEPKVLGEWTTGHYAMAVLYLLNTKDTKDIYNNNSNNLDEFAKESINRLIEQIPHMLS